MIIDLERTGKMTLADFDWNKEANELYTRALWPDDHIPVIIFIHGKIRTVKYIYSQTITGARLAGFRAAQSEHGRDLLPKAYVEF